MSLFERFVASRYLRSKRKESFISVIAAFSFTGIMLGVATLIIVMSVMNGFRHELISRILGINGHINVQGQPIVQNYEQVIPEIEGVNGVIDAIPYIEGQVLIQTRNVSRGGIVRGMRTQDIEKNKLVFDNIVSGDLNLFEGNAVFIGRGMASKLGLSIGSRLTLFSSESKVSPFGTVPKTVRPIVAGIFDIGMYEYDNNFIFMPLDTAQVFFNQKGRVSLIQIKATSAENLDVIKEDLQEVLGPYAIITDWKRNNGSFFNALQVERNVMFLILTLIILVAAFNIISSLIMLVKDKGKEIAILRTIGASRASIMRIFIMTGASIGMFGTLAGSTLGILFAVNIEHIRRFLESLSGTELFSPEIYFLSKLPAIIDWGEVTTVVLMALVLSLLATIYPAWRASNLDPVEALRYE